MLPWLVKGSQIATVAAMTFIVGATAALAAVALPPWALTPNRPTPLFTALARTRPTTADSAPWPDYTYNPSADKSQPATTVPLDIYNLLDVPLDKAHTQFVGFVTRGFTDFFGDGPVMFVVARTNSVARWFAEQNKAGIGADATRDTTLNDPGTLLYSVGGTEWAVAIRGPVVVSAPADSGAAEAEALLHVGLRYLGRVERTHR